MHSNIKRYFPMPESFSRFCAGFLALSLLAACAPSKAFIDKSPMGQIIWPGPPEKPRISYTWNITRISGTEEGKRGLLEFMLGEEGAETGESRSRSVLARPYCLFVDSGEKLYITDPGHYRVTVVDLKTSEAFNISAAGKINFLSPIGVVADPRGRIYVSDSTLANVFAFDEKGRYLFRFEGDFKRPTGMAIDSRNSRIYVSDTAAHTVYVYDFDGKRTGSLGKPGSLPGEFNFPTHLFVDGNSLLYVMDAMNFRVQVFSQEGNLRETIGSLGDSHGNLDKPKGVAADSSGRVYVVDSIRDTVKIFGRTGEILLSFGNKGRNIGDFWLPSGIFIDGNNMIYVADTYNMRVQVFEYIGENGD